MEKNVAPKLRQYHQTYRYKTGVNVPFAHIKITYL